MKIISFIFLSFVALFAAPLGANAQSELTWNRALIVTAEEIVPEGMVWKVSNYFPSCAMQLNNTDSSRDFTMTINGNTTYLYGIDTAYAIFNGSPALYGYSGGLPGNDFWLPAGTTLAPGNCVWGISVVEFSIQ